MPAIITASVDPELFIEIKKARGSMPRSHFVAEALRMYLRELQRDGYQ